MAPERGFRWCWQSEDQMELMEVDRQGFPLLAERERFEGTAAVQRLKGLLQMLPIALGMRKRRALQAMWNRDLLPGLGNRSYP